MKLKLNTKEAELLTEIVNRGDLVTEIIKNENEFRVRYRCKDYYSDGYCGEGSSAKVYNLLGSFQASVKKIKELDLSPLGR